MVYKSGLKDSEALQVVCDALEKINRPNKAQLIRAELRRIANMKISPEARGKARQTIEDQVTTTLAGSGDVPVSDTAEVTRSELLPLIVDELQDVQKSSQINSDQEPLPKDSAVDQSKGDEPVKHSGKITFLDPRVLMRKPRSTASMSRRRLAASLIASIAAMSVLMKFLNTW